MSATAPRRTPLRRLGEWSVLMLLRVMFLVLGLSIGTIGSLAGYEALRVAFGWD